MPFRRIESDPDYEDDAWKDLIFRYMPSTSSSPMNAIAGTRQKKLPSGGSVLDHFDAVKIGLTATPALHTLSLFKEVDLPVYDGRGHP